MRCKFIDFEYIGYHDSSENTSNGYAIQRDVQMLRNSSATCVLCRKICELLEGQIARVEPSRQADLDIANMRVDTALEIDWHETSPEEGSSPLQTHSARLRINCTANARDHEGVFESKDTLHLTFFFQKNGNEPKNLHSGNDLSPALIEQPYSARRRPETVDYGLLRSWYSACDKKHGPACAKIFEATPKILPRVIDVEKRCLKQADSSDAWVCLSYVWGTANTLCLRRQNEQYFHIEGSLTVELLPAMIEDTLQLTQGLGWRYLWVDALCIIQDDDIDKARFISQMDSIYAWARLVIFATTCVDANSRLPGISAGSRGVLSESFEIEGIQLIQSLDPVIGVAIDLRTQRANPYIGETVWDTRGWTLQERYLAARALVFTENQVFWECDRAFWCEDSCREIANVLPDPHKTSLCGGELTLSWKPSDFITFDHYYRVLVAEFSVRALKYENDALNAFSGIINAFRRGMRIDFYWGLPCCCLESALSWGNRTLGLRRRQDSPHTGASVVNSGTFGPSWSWASWIGDGSTKLDTQNLIMQRLGIEFYRLSDDASRMIHLQQRGSPVGEVDLLVNGSQMPSRDRRVSSVSLKDVPRKVPRESLSSLLFFWTASTFVDLVYADDSDIRSVYQTSAISLNWNITIA